MSEHVEGLNRNQTALFPETLEGYVDKENPVRFIDAFVDSLNLEKLGFKHSIPVEVGRQPYNPSDLLKLYVYGYLNQIRSSRKLERECHRNIEVMWLMRKLTPDFKTIADFLKDNIDCVKGVFKEFVKLCMSLDLYGAKCIAIDERHRCHPATMSTTSKPELPEFPSITIVLVVLLLAVTKNIILQKHKLG
jgi:transposase